MVERIIKYSLHNRAIILIASAFLALWGIWAVKHTPVDAIPDLSDNQVIVMTDWMGRAPQIVEDQVTYPLQSVLRGMPRVKAVRGLSMFGVSMIYVIFEDDVDIYWARSRVLEKLTEVQGLLPAGARAALGPDGTGVGHVYWYTVEGKGYDLAELRSIQDWYLRIGLSSVPGVAEVASIGGFVKEYQVDLDPLRMQNYGVSTMMIMNAIRSSNVDVGGGLFERSSMEYNIRGLGYIESVSDIKNIVVMADVRGVPITVGDVATVQLGGAVRRGLLEKNGEGEVVGGIIVMRYGEHAQQVIDRVKNRIKELERGLPAGVSVKMAYDRSDLIQRALGTLREALLEELLIVALVVIVFLLHFRSSLIIIISLPIAVMSAFIAMYYFKITFNLMSLAGIAIAVGEMVDAGIIVVENAYRRLSEGSEQERRDLLGTVWEASRTVGRPIFFSMAIIIVSFGPVFLLEGQEGKLFIPLAVTKTACMAFGALLAITLTPVLSTMLLKGKLTREDRNPLSRWLVRLYEPVLSLALRFKKTTLLLNVVILAITIVILLGLGSEFMPALDEGSLLFMPTTLPNISISEAKRIMQMQDKIIKSIPEVDLVLGKVGRAETATDPAPISMIETIILLKPQKDWRKGLTRDDIIAEMDQKLQIPGVANGWTQPIINRINMLATGVRTDLGIKIYGPDLNTLERLAIEAADIVRPIRGASDVIAERVIGGNYLDIRPDRNQLARYGLSMESVQSSIEVASGGMTVTTTLEDRARYPVRVRYARDFRDSPDALQRILLNTPSGQQITLSQVATIAIHDGPTMISSENALPRSTVYLNVRGRDLGSFVGEAKNAIERSLKLPPGYFVEWSGQWENQIRAKQRLQIIVPIGLLLIFVLLYFVFRSFAEAALVMLSVPFSLTGGVLSIWLLGYNWSVAVSVGFLALYGVAVQTGIVMVVYLHEALNNRLREGTIGMADLRAAVIEGSVARLRPKLMTVATTGLGLLPIIWATGTGADLMKPVAAPVVGGLLSSALHVLIVTPVIFSLMKERELRRGLLKPSVMYLE